MAMDVKFIQYQNLHFEHGKVPVPYLPLRSSDGRTDAVQCAPANKANVSRFAF